MKKIKINKKRISRYINVFNRNIIDSLRFDAATFKSRLVKFSKLKPRKIVKLSHSGLCPFLLKISQHKNDLKVVE